MANKDAIINFKRSVCGGKFFSRLVLWYSIICHAALAPVSDCGLVQEKNTIVYVNIIALNYLFLTISSDQKFQVMRMMTHDRRNPVMELNMKSKIHIITSSVYFCTLTDSLQMSVGKNY